MILSSYVGYKKVLNLFSLFLHSVDRLTFFEKKKKEDEMDQREIHTTIKRKDTPSFLVLLALWCLGSNEKKFFFSFSFSFSFLFFKRKRASQKNNSIVVFHPNKPKPSFSSSRSQVSSLKSQVLSLKTQISLTRTDHRFLPSVSRSVLLLVLN